MGIIKTKGIVIKVANSSDNDRMLTLLTPDLGKINVFCKGAKKNKSAFLSSTEYLAFSEIVVFNSNNSELYSLTSADTIEVFYKLRENIEKLSYATTIAKIICDVTNPNEKSDEVMKLLLNTLYVLSETDKNMDLIFAIFEIRLLALIGFAPRLSKCVNCSETITEDKDTYYFSIKDNGVKCEACSKQDKGVIKLNKTSFASLIYILSCEPKKLYSFEIPIDSIDELRVLAKIYLTEKLEKEYKVIKY